MGLHTYTFVFEGRTIGVKAKKTEAENIARRIKKLTSIHKYRKEITGVVGGESHEWVTMNVFGPSGVDIADPQEYLKDVGAFAKKLPDVLTQENARGYLQEAEEIFQKHIPIVDNRRTSHELAESHAAAKAADEARAAKAKAWRDEWCLPDMVRIPEGQMAVCLEMTFDDSHTMTDYFSPHAGIGEDMLLAIVPKQPQTERLARRILARYPELDKLSWTWHVENYSMGHGNYLISEWCGEADRSAYDGRDKVSTRWEIQCSGYRRELYPYKEYPGTQDSQAVSAVNAQVTDATVRRNEEHNGIEVVFPAKPGQETLDTLKSMGFRWSRPKGLWYAKYREDLYKRTQELVADMASVAN